MDRKAKIVATIGPASESEEILRELILAGMDVARLNFSHGSHEEHANRIATIRKLSKEMSRPIAILQDLQGPKLRVGTLPAEGVKLELHQRVFLTSLDTHPEDILNLKEALLLPLEVPNLVNSLRIDDRILLDDGKLELRVLSVARQYIEAEVILPGVLKSHKGVNLPGVNLKIQSLTEKDLVDLKFGLDQGVDYIALSFVRSGKDVQSLRTAIRVLCPGREDTPIIAKLERPEAICNLNEILEGTDGVMVARGDLGVETSPSSVPIIQKEIIQAANRNAKLVITATQMLESMISSPRPTRAEASDVANAIFDGTGAVMLSGETAMGTYPVETIRMMHQIVVEAETHFNAWGRNLVLENINMDDATAITRAAKELANDRDVVGIAVFTQTGRTAELMANARPKAPILAFTPEEDTYHRMGLYWGTRSYMVPFAANVETMLDVVDQAIIGSTTLKPGDQIIMISGFPVGATRPPNFTLLHTIGERL